MTVEIADPVVRALATEGAKQIYSTIVGAGTKKSATTASSLESSLARHLKYVFSWASQYSFLGLSNPKDSRASTIPLRMTNVPRRYKGQGESAKSETPEDSFLKDSNPVVLLGDPGAGKTTTLKRICLHLLQEPALDDEVGFQVPLLVVLRDLEGHPSVIPYLGAVLDIPVQAVGGADSAKFPFTIFGFDAAEKVADILDAISAVLIVDGLDEVPLSERQFIERELRLLATYCRSAKIIVSCRSGDYNRSIDGYSVFEILPLSREEVVQISRSWLNNYEEFIEHLDSKPYHDIVDRPLLLSFLIFLFYAEKQLPPRPSLIYRKVVYRLLKDWDDERGITRGSAYSNFDIDAKIDFLSEFSYLLTYKLKSRGFLEEDALRILEEIGQTYELPKRQLKDVLREIETHTGIIVAAGFSRFEFAHLSVQEYLCANFISRSPIPQLLKSYLAEYPAPVAVACALSSQPDQFLNQMLRRHLLDKFRNPEDFFHSVASGQEPLLDIFGQDTSNTLLSFLSRLELEQPTFRATFEFGEAILMLYAFYYRRYSRAIDDLINAIAMPESGRMGLKAFFAKKKWNSHSVTNSTSAIFIDSIFVDIYEEIAGPWPSDDPKANILPVAMLPKAILDFLGVNVIALESRELSERVKRNLSGTQLCEIEFGQHSRRTVNSVCDICGNKVASTLPRPDRIQKVKRKRIKN